MKRLKEIVKRNLFGIIIGIILCGVTITIAETAITASMVEYDTTVSEKSYDNVQGALDDLYRGLYDIASATTSGISLIIHNPKGLSTELVAGLYRFQGTNDQVDNYICFGTTDKDTCTGDTDKYMYRIIGIDENGRMKLIKKEALNTAYQWNSTTGVTWPNSDLYKRLNGLDETTNYFLGTDYVPSEWEDRIVMAEWHHAIMWVSNTSTADSISQTELSASSTNGKIGLVYIHDYYRGLSGSQNCYKNHSTCLPSWIHLSKNDGTSPSNTEWTITLSTNSGNPPYYLDSDGGIQQANSNMTYTRSVRPVFYIGATEVIAGGEGTLANPYRLA